MSNIMHIPQVNGTVNRNQTAILITSFLSGKKPRTLAAYKRDLEDFARFVGAKDMDEAAQILLGHNHGTANLTALRFKDHLLQNGLAPSTINRHLAALRSLVALANTLGMVPWKLEVKGLKSIPLRDTKGCGVDVLKTLLAVARKQRNASKGARDVAILRLLYDLALRRSEVAALEVSDVDLAQSRIMVMGKGRNEKEPFTLPDETKKAISDWLQIRNSEDPALFLNFDRAHKGNALTDDGIYRLIRSLGRRAKVPANQTPHKLRHTAITEVLNITNGNIRVAQRFARHSSPSTTIRYDDNRTDLGGDAAKQLASRIC